MVRDNINFWENSLFKKKDMRILIVDDEQSIVGLLAKVLAIAGYSCETAKEGNTALDLIRKKPFDLIICDIVMPGLSGIELIKQAQLDGFHSHVIFITGNRQYEYVYQAIQLRSLGFIEKPFSISKIVKLVDEAYKVICKSIKQKKHEEKLKQSLEDKNKELEFRTERLAAEKEILHGIISDANFGLIAVDITEAVHLMNSLAIDLLDINNKDSLCYVGRNYHDLFPEIIVPTITQLYKNVLTTQTLQEINSIKNFSERSLNIIAYPLFHEKQISAVVFVIHDITEKEDLQHRFLQNAKLASIGELAAGVAHEINNPLGFVLSNSNTLREYITSFDKYINALEKIITENGISDSNPKVSTTYEDIKEELDIGYIKEDITSLLNETTDGLKRISKIVADLKTFARADSDTPEKHQVNSLIEDALNLTRNETKYKLKINKNLSDLPEITCFPSQLVQVFTNMFINASHAVSDKGTLEIKTTSDDDNVIISIKDDGSGIPEKVLPHIFDPFFTTKEAGKGTGLGLSISYGIIKKHEGTITVNSKEGEGTEFIIKLPLNKILEQTPA